MVPGIREDASSRRTASWSFLGRVGYREALHLQIALAERLGEGAEPLLAGWVLFLEHPPVYTIGLSGSPVDILAPPSGHGTVGIAIERTDRGGKTTYHGPGQIVGYPILHLGRLGLGPAPYVRGIEQAILDALEGWGVEGRRIEGKPGIFVRDGKIASIGIRLHRGVAYHGFALNIAVDLEPFGGIVACGDPSGRGTSLDRLLPRVPGLAAAAEVLATHLARSLRLELVAGPPAMVPGCPNSPNN